MKIARLRDANNCEKNSEDYEVHRLHGERVFIPEEILRTKGTESKRGTVIGFSLP